MPIEKNNILKVYRSLIDITDEEMTRLLKSLALGRKQYEKRIARLLDTLVIPEEGLDPGFVASRIDRELSAAGVIDLDLDTTEGKMDDLFREYQADPFRGKPLPAHVAAELREIKDVNMVRTRNFMRRNADRLRNFGKTQWVEFLQDKGGNVATYAETLVRTEVNGALTDRTMAAADQAEVEYYRYDGVLSKNSRQFCWNHAGKIYHIDTIMQLDNGKLNPVITYRGGYNCVHRWTPLPFYQRKAA